MSADWRALELAAGAAATRLREAWGTPDRAQEAMLARILAQGADSAFGRAHGFGAIDGVAAFRRRVPVRGYDDFAPWIGRAAAGEAQVLTAAPPLCFEETSGSAGARKLIPYTAALLEDFRVAALPWLEAALATASARRGALYVALSPATRAPRRTPCGAPIGLSSDAAYLGEELGAALAGLLAVPPEVGEIRDAATWRRATLAALIESESLTFVSVWSPTYFTALLDAIPEEAEALALRLSPQARARLAAALAGGVLEAARLWPDLSVVSCWCDGPSAPFARRLAEALHGVTLHPKGLLATEAAVTTPLRLSLKVEARAPALLSAFLEFLDEGGAPRGAHQLVEGGVYRVLVTTSGGLYRYDLGDDLVCEGFAVAGGLRAPHLAFLGRAGVSDLVGEKLSESFVATALAAAPAPAALQPRTAPAGYTLLIETQAPQESLAALRDDIERRLCANPHYAHARAMGQLAPLSIEGVADLAARFAKSGARLATTKPRVLLPLA